MTRHLLLAALLTFVLGAGHAASAQSYGQNNGSEDFTGPYLGGTVGYGWGDFDANTLSFDGHENALKLGAVYRF